MSPPCPRPAVPLPVAVPGGVLPRWRRTLSLALGVACAPALAAEPTTAPQPRLEAGMHTAMIWRIATDAQGRWAVSASYDKTARLWDLKTNRLLGVIRPPQDVGNEGKLEAVAMSPDGSRIAVAGWTGWDWDGQASIYVYRHDPQTHRLSWERRISNVSITIKHLAFSPGKGRWLAAGLARDSGVRVFDAANGRLTGVDKAYGDSCLSE